MVKKIYQVYVNGVHCYNEYDLINVKLDLIHERSNDFNYDKHYSVKTVWQFIKPTRSTKDNWLKHIGLYEEPFDNYDVEF